LGYRTLAMQDGVSMSVDGCVRACMMIFHVCPMEARVVDIYDRHEALFDDDARAVWKAAPHPFRLPNLHITESTEQSMAINRIENGAIVIAGSGMANGGRILHHFRHGIERRTTHVVFRSEEHTSEL